MARILFTWELGRGLGHLVRYKALIASLTQDGHEVHYIARNADKVRLVNPQPELRVQQIGPEFTPRPQQVTDPRLTSYSTLLFNCGFSNVEKLVFRLQRWIEAIKGIQPDCIVADHSPTAMLANQVLKIPLIIAGNGFTLPPAMQPMPLFLPEHSVSDGLSIEFEHQLCDVLNASIRKIQKNVPKIENPAALLKVDQSWLMTFRELDCYGARRNANYLGTYPNDGFGEDFDWPKADGPKVFAYMQSQKGLEALGSWIAERGARLCLVLPKSAQKHAEMVSQVFPKTLCHVFENPINLTKVLAEAEVGISNGNANLLANLALAGIPQLTIPVSMENYMEARQAVDASCSLMAAGPDFSGMSAQLDELLDNDIFRAGAARLAEIYAGSTSERQSEILRKNLYELIG